MAFQDLIYPRRKNFIKNLNILLDTSPVLSPEKAIAAKIINRNFNSQSPTKSQSSSKLQHGNLLKVAQSQKLFSLRKLELRKSQEQEKVKVRHRDTKSANPVNSARSIRTSQLFNVINSVEIKSQRKMVTQGSSRAKRFETFNKGGFSERGQFAMSISTQRPRGSLSLSPAKYESEQLKGANESAPYDFRTKQEIKKDYLKKGSRIKSSIVQNIVRMKLINSHQPEKFGTDNYAESQEILKLLKLFMGTQMIKKQQKLPESKPQDPRKRATERAKDPLHIEGWLNEAEEFEDHDAVIEKDIDVSEVVQNMVN